MVQTGQIFICRPANYLMKFIALLLVPFLIVPAFAETQTLQSDGGALDVRITHDPIKPDEQVRVMIEFINPVLQRVQEHIDYTVKVSKDGDAVFGPIPLTHTSPGIVRIPIEFSKGEGIYSMEIEMEGILFQPIPTEIVSFDIQVGQADAQSNGQAGGQNVVQDDVQENLSLIHI